MLHQLQKISFLHPVWLLLLLLIPVMIYVQYFFKGRRKSSFTVPSFDIFPAQKSWKISLLPFVEALPLISLAAFIITLARPQLSLEEEEVRADGIDIVMAIDVSSSMLAKDFQPDRLEASKRVAMDFVSKRRHDRIGLAVFSGESFTQCPLTSDHIILSRFIEGIQCGVLSEGTAIGMGLATAVNRLRDSDAKSKVVILLTDGDNNTGYIKPMTAAEIAKELEVKVYTIGVGSRGMALTPQGRRSDGTFVFDYARVLINEQLLTDIAQTTGGQYFRASNDEQLVQIYDQIDQLETTEREVTVYKRYAEKFRLPLSWGIVSMLLYFIFNYSLFKRFP